MHATCHALIKEHRRRPGKETKRQMPLVPTAIALSAPLTALQLQSAERQSFLGRLSWVLIPLCDQQQERTSAPPCPAAKVPLGKQVSSLDSRGRSQKPAPHEAPQQPKTPNRIGSSARV